MTVPFIDDGGNDVIEELPYLRDSGINAIELMPLSEFSDVWSYGYNPANLFAVKKAYGESNELKKLVKRAHELGMAVILDVFYNHFSLHFPRHSDDLPGAGNSRL